MRNICCRIFRIATTKILTLYVTKRVSDDWTQILTRPRVPHSGMTRTQVWNTVSPFSLQISALHLSAVWVPAFMLLCLLGTWPLTALKSHPYSLWPRIKMALSFQLQLLIAGERVRICLNILSFQVSYLKSTRKTAFCLKMWHFTIISI